MGEYATFKGKQIKIGTCEDMYYLRADHASSVTAKDRSETNPIACADSIRFRFPFPDEDAIEPGAFDDYGRAIYLHGLEVPEGVEHSSVQFSAQAGYLVSLPCPESGKCPVPFARNGFAGNVGITQQRVVNDKLVLILRCGGCGAKWRCEEEEAALIVSACREEAEAADHLEWVSSRVQGPVQPSSRGNWWRQIAKRIESGYTSPLPWLAVQA